MVEGNMDVEAVHAMLMNLTPKTVVEMMKVSREEREKVKGVNQDTTGIRVAVTAPDLVLGHITKG